MKAIKKKYVVAPLAMLAFFTNGHTKHDLNKEYGMQGTESLLLNEEIIDLGSAFGDMLGRNSILSACGSQNNSRMYYFERSSVWGLIPGDIIYTNSTGTSTLNGGNKWYKIGQHAHLISPTGVILQIDDCGVLD